MGALLILGSGGHGKVVADAALLMNRWDAIAFADDSVDGTIEPMGIPIVGRIAECESLGRRFDAIAIGLGNNEQRLSLLLKCQSQGFDLPVIVHPSAYVSPFARIGAGSVICAQGAVNPGAVLGLACIVNTGATIDHDCQIGNAVHVSPGGHLGGNVVVGARAWLGIGCCVRQGLIVGEGAVVGAGSVVVSNVQAKTTVYGVPAKVRT